MKQKSKKILIHKDSSLNKCMKVMNQFGYKCLILFDHNKKLYGSLSDGDIRKFLTSNYNKSINAALLATKNCKYVIKGKYQKKDIEKIFNNEDIFVIPEIDEQKHITNIFLKKDLKDFKYSEELINYNLVIMAGGFGKRIGKFTEILPKALLPIKNTTIISKILESYYLYGINKVLITINYRSEIIKSYLSQYKKKFKIKFISERKPLGTVGSLSKLSNLNNPFFLTNCDIFTTYDKSALIKSHLDSKNDLTVVVSKKSINFDYGVCKIDKNNNLISIKEKPIYSNIVIVGQYIISPKILKFIPKNELFNMNDLLEVLFKKKCKVGTYRIKDNDWIDVGQWNLYKNSLKALE